jgi:hypothetical protein
VNVLAPWATGTSPLAFQADGLAGGEREGPDVVAAGRDGDARLAIGRGQEADAAVGEDEPGGLAALVVAWDDLAAADHLDVHAAHLEDRAERGHGDDPPIGAEGLAHVDPLPGPVLLIPAQDRPVEVGDDAEAAEHGLGPVGHRRRRFRLRLGGVRPGFGARGLGRDRLGRDGGRRRRERRHNLGGRGGRGGRDRGAAAGGRREHPGRGGHQRDQGERGERQRQARQDRAARRHLGRPHLGRPGAVARRRADGREAQLRIGDGGRHLASDRLAAPHEAVHALARGGRHLRLLADQAEDLVAAGHLGQMGVGAEAELLEFGDAVRIELIVEVRGDEVRVGRVGAGRGRHAQTAAACDVLDAVHQLGGDRALGHLPADVPDLLGAEGVVHPGQEGAQGQPKSAQVLMRCRHGDRPGSGVRVAWVASSGPC